MEATFDHRTITWNTYPDGPFDYEFKKEQEVNSLGLGVQQQQQQQQQQQVGSAWLRGCSHPCCG